MKHYLLALLLLPGIASALDTIEIKTRITDVVLYYSGAQINRTADVQLKAGEQLLFIRGLSRHLVPASIQIAGLGDASLLSKQAGLYERPFIPDQSALTPLIKQEKQLHDELFDLRQELTVYEQEEKIILQNSALEQSRTNAVQTLREGADFYRQRLLDIRRIRTRIKRDIENKQAQMKLIYQQMNQLQPQALPAEQAIYLHIRVEKPFKAKLELGYFDEAAGWQPAYEFRFKQYGSPLELIYQAEVHQFGGEDWKNIPIRLSTAKPNLSSTKPVFKPWILGQTKPGQIEVVQSTAILQSRTGNIRGKVVDESSKKMGIPFANVELEQNGRTLGRVESDLDGFYQFHHLQPGQYDLRVKYVGFNPALVRKINVVANKSQNVEIALRSGVELSIIEIVDYEVPLISKDEMSSGGTITRSEIAKSRVREVNSIAATTAGVFLPNEQNREQSYYVDGMKVNHQSPLHLEVLFAELSRQPDELLVYTLAEKQSLSSDGEARLWFIQKIEVPARYVYYLLPRVERESYLVAEIADFRQLKLLDGPASIYYQGSYLGNSEIKSNQLSDTLLFGLGRDPGVQAVRSQESEKITKKSFGSSRQDMLANIVVYSTKDVPVEVVVEDQLPISQHNQVQIDWQLSHAGEADPEVGLIRWKLQLVPAVQQVLQQKISIRIR